ncbi:substrate-binding domain-containing protein [Haloplanus sp. GCM10025708]|uniref:substrate-binding domain-containing protein n=1 Tax=Haloplanus sp. GCM10025708 TaxID=3252679 RepID=UPI0036213103
MTGNSGAGRELLSRRNFLVASGAVGVAGLAGCTENPSDGGDQGTTTGDSASLSGTINIAGSSTVFPLATQMKSAFQREYPDVKVNVQSTGTGGGFQNNFCPGNTDFNNASRPITDAERELCSKNGVEPVELKVATDALTVVVNNEAGWVDCITVDELAQIWSPENPPQRWSDVNADWPDETFNLFGPSQASGTFDYFTEVIVGEEEVPHGLQSDRERQRHHPGRLEKRVRDGLSRIRLLHRELGQREGPESRRRRRLYRPVAETAKSGEYTPLSRPLFTYAAKSSLAEEHVAEFARFWIENSTSQELVAQNVGYVPNTEDEKAEMMDRLEAAIEEAQG